MLEIIYRIYEKIELKKQYDSEYAPFEDKVCLTMDVCICESRDAFKKIIKDTYGNIPFKASKTYEVGQQYCVIIGEHCYNTEKYFTKYTFDCAYCNTTMETYVNNFVHIEHYELQGDEYSKLKFCCSKCKDKYVQKEKARLCEEQGFDDTFIGKNSFEPSNGYIYKITKKSTGEFYVGQTIYCPVFRWGQHLRTSRFPLKNIIDYQFEVIEQVANNCNILEREKYWIQYWYAQCPEKSLNIMQTANIDVTINDKVNLFDSNKGEVIE